MRTLKPKAAMQLEPLEFIKWLTNHRGGHAHELKAWCSRYVGLKMDPNHMAKKAEAEEFVV